MKAAPQVGERHGETVCCAGVDVYGKWLRLFPVSFRTFDDCQRFGRWNRVRFKWRLPKDDQRVESRRVDHGSFQVVGKTPKPDRAKLLGPMIVSGLVRERAKNRSLALLRPRSPSFSYDRKPQARVDKERELLASVAAQADLFNAKPIVPYEPCPYFFRYSYRVDEGSRTGKCQDWEIEATFFKWRRDLGEDAALPEMQKVFGKEYPSKGMLLAMGTHSRYPDTWLINGVIRMDEIHQMSLF